MYRVLLARKAANDLDHVDARDRPRIVEAIQMLATDPHLGKPLAGKLQDMYSYRVWPYRVLYEIHKQELIVLVIRIGHRQGVYHP